jgi:acyl transferase domain-containing protein
VWAKKYSITEVPPDRWSVADYYDPDPAAPAKTYSKIGSWVRGFEFDWKRWHIPPRVAGAMDEGQQWAISIAAEALADYGYPGKPLDTERTAVVLGNAMAGERHYLTTLRISFPEYRRLLLEAKEFLELPADVRSAILSRWNEVVAKGMPEITEDTMPGELSNILSGRVANVLNLRPKTGFLQSLSGTQLFGVNLYEGHRGHGCSGSGPVGSRVSLTLKGTNGSC